jgi:hypothetical protein
MKKLNQPGLEKSIRSFLVNSISTILNARIWNTSKNSNNKEKVKIY